MSDFIPVYSPQLTGGEWDNVKECLETSWISSRGRFVDEFEQAFAAYVDVPHAISVCNGTVALHLALAGLGIGHGHRVIVPTFTYIASVNAIRYVGAEPVFVDSNFDTLQMCVSDLERKVSEGGISAILCVHLYGQSCDMEAIHAIAQRAGIQVIEDCAEAFGTRIGNQHVGYNADVATYSFFGNKTITTGEGGMVTTSNADLARFLRKLRGQGLAGDREYWHDVIGFNFRMTNICAGIGLAQLERADEILQRKREIAAFYRNIAKDTPLTFHDELPGTTHSFWMCSVLTPNARERDALREHLRVNGIETRPFFYPAHTMPMYEAWGADDYPVANDVAFRGINLPSYPGLTEVQLRRIGRSLREFYQA